MFRRRWLALVGWLLAACASEDRALEESGRGSVKEPDGDSESDDDGDDDRDVDENSRQDEDEKTCVRGGEFGECLDAGNASPTINDAACAQASGDEFAGECPYQSQPDAGGPDAAAPVDEPCTQKPLACRGDPLAEVQTAGAECELWSGNMLRVSYTSCEVCGESGWISSGSIVVRDCGGCDFVFASTNGTTNVSAGACLTTDGSASLHQTATNPACFDVYGLAHGFYQGTHHDGEDEHYKRLCRCSIDTGKCTACAGGNCPDD